MQTNTPVLMRSGLLLLLLLLAAWLSSYPFFGSAPPIMQGPVLLDDSDEALDVAGAVRRARLVLEHGDRGDFTIHSRNYWWVAEVENPTDVENWVAHMGNPSIERVELFVFAGAELEHHATVDLLAEASGELPDYIIGHHFPFHLPAGGSRTIALRLETEVAHGGLIFIKPEAVAVAEAHFHMVAIWTGAGAIIALIGYNLFLGLGLRVSTYLYYVGHASGHLLYLLTALGIIGAAFPVLDRYLWFNIPGIGLGVFFGAVFIYTFLELPSLSPLLARLFRLFIGMMALSPLLALLLEPHEFFTLIRGSHLILAVLVMAAALTGVVRRKYEARYILIGWGGLIAMTAKGMLGVLGVVELTIDAGVWALWAMLFEMFFLSLALADRVRRLTREKDAAEAATAAKSAFLANMSHEIRTPLNGVLGMVDVLRGTPLDHKQREYIENIGQSGAALLAVLDDILDYSRVEAGRITLEQAEFEPRRLLEQLHFLLTPQAEKRGLRLELTIDPRVPPVLVGDPGRLRQVLLNLLGNALKFTERGTVHLKLELVSRDDAGNRLRFTVSDSGIGMEADTLKHLFDRFHQADSSITRRFGGSGLGLAIVKELVALMGGSIRVDSQPGLGSDFEVELTLPTGSRSVEPEAEASDTALPPLNILVVDDDDINRLVATTLLVGEGHQVAAVASGAAALERFGQESFDVVLMDLGMPEMDGLEATRRLRAAGTAIPIIGLTAHVLPEQQAACLAAGMNAVAHKPVRPGKLKSIIAASLQLAEAVDPGFETAP